MRWRWRWPAGCSVVLLLGLGAALWPHGERPATPATPAPPGPAFPGPLPERPSPPDRAALRRVLAERVRLTDHTYCSYLRHTRYPHDSRPAGHHPDQLHPNRPVRETHPMRRADGQTDAEVVLGTAQSRVYLAAGEPVDFALDARDARGQPLALVVTRAVAQGLADGAARAGPRVTLAFAEEGGAWRGVLAPRDGALAGFHGTIRTEVRYRAAGKDGVALFDVVYSPTLPALWSGAPREAVVDGALRFTLPLEVRQPGRYVVSGRIDDARGRPFALATFNEELAAGPQQVHLTVFGKLLHDGAPPLPLTLRDVEGYLLREDLDPDRLLLARREGRVATGRTASLDGVANGEWQSEERSRYLTEYARDRAAARSLLARVDPSAVLPPDECAPPPLPDQQSGSAAGNQ